MSRELSPETLRRAERLQRWADRLTAFRANHSNKIGVAIAATERTWATTAGVAVMIATDYLDGALAKRAQAMLGVSGPLTDGGTQDPRADKIFRSAVLDGMQQRAVWQLDAPTLAFISVKTELDKRRDYQMAIAREDALEVGVNTGAIQTNRLKTAGEMASILLHVSPLANNEHVRLASLGVMAVGTGLGWVGLHQYQDMVAQGMPQAA